MYHTVSQYFVQLASFVETGESLRVTDKAGSNAIRYFRVSYHGIRYALNWINIIFSSNFILMHKEND